MWVWSPWKSVVSFGKTASALRVAFDVWVKKKKKRLNQVWRGLGQEAGPDIQFQNLHVMEKAH